MRTPPTCFAVVVAMMALLSLTSCSRDEGLEQLKTHAQLAEQAYKQYKTADYPTAKAALLNLIAEFERRLASGSDPNVETLKGDIVLSYVRLAKLEEKNNGSEKDAYMQKAVALCQQQKIKYDCSAEGVRKRVDAVDEIVQVKP